MTNDILQKVITSVPVDATAARVTGRGEHWEPKRKVSNTHFTEQPEIRVPDKSELINVKSGWHDFRGHNYGRFTVVGIYAGKKANGCSWVVRCLCGDYELRKARAMRHPENQSDCCDKCMSLVYLKKRAHHRLTGEYAEFK